MSAPVSAHLRAIRSHPLLVVLVLAGLVALTGPAAAQEVRFVTTPAETQVRVLNPPEQPRRTERFIAAPGQALLFDRRRDTTFQVQFEAAGHERTVVNLTLGRDQITVDGRPFPSPRRGPYEVPVVLPALQVERRIDIASEPAGALVRVDGEARGRTPLAVTVRFSRPNGRAPWSTVRLEAELADHFPLERTLTADAVSGPGLLTLERARQSRRFRLRAVGAKGERAAVLARTDAGEEFEVPLAGVEREIVFSRPRAGAPFEPRTLELRGREQFGELVDFELQTVRLTVDQSESDWVVEMKPVLLVERPRLFPGLVVADGGLTVGFDETRVKAMWDETDSDTTGGPAERITQVARGPRAHHLVGSFAVAAAEAGLTLFYSRIEAEQGRPVRAQLREAQLGSDGITLQAREAVLFGEEEGEEGLFLNPTAGYHNGEPVLYLQAYSAETRGRFQVYRLSKDPVAQGPIHVDPQVHAISPALATVDSPDLPMVYLTLDPGTTRPPALELYLPRSGQLGRVPLPLAAARLLHERPTIHAFAGTPVLVYVQSVGTRDGTRRLFARSLRLPGRIEGTPVALGERFRDADVIHPAISPDGRWLLFASNTHIDFSNRRNFDLHLAPIRYEDGRLIAGPAIQLTDNESDDLLPLWDPTRERWTDAGGPPGPVRFYFLSNRGSPGVHNIWSKTVRLPGPER